MTSIAVREATDAEIVSVYGPKARHIVGTVDGVAYAYIAFSRIGDVWGMYEPLRPAAPSVWTKLFYAFRRELRAHMEPVYVLATDASAARLLRLLGMKPTGRHSVGKEIWQWMPDKCS